MFLLYNFLLTLFSPIWVPWMLWRTWRRREKPNWQERMGNLTAVPAKAKRPRLWVHAVSVGEVVAARPILRELRKALPEHEIVLSVTTSSGHQTAREGDTSLFDYLIYFPIDVARFQFVAMQRVRPDAVLVMETELWMNHLWAAKVFGAHTLLVNGRISDRSYPRAMKIRFLYRSLLANMDRCLMQSQVDADRIRSLGAKSAEVLGNAKFDQAVEGRDAEPAALRKTLALPEGKPVLVVGSTRGAGEEDLVMDAIARVGLEKLSVIHAPRHLESAPDLAARVTAKFGSVALRSLGQTGPYLVLDTYGELAKIYSVADIAVVGGGFENLGGQNVVQPLAQGKPVLHGPYMQNFREVTAMADAAGAAIVCRDAGTLAAAITKLIDDPALCSQMSAAALTLVESNTGASRRYAEAVAGTLR